MSKLNLFFWGLLVAIVLFIQTYPVFHIFVVLRCLIIALGGIVFWDTPHKSFYPCIVFAFAYAISFLFTFHLSKESVEFFLTLCTFPLFYLFLASKNNNMQKYLIVFCAVVILSAIPYYLNIFQQNGRLTNMNAYGDYEAYSGAFLSPHSASIVYTLSCIVALYFFLFSSKHNFLFLLIFLVGTYDIYRTYIRTGYVMFFVGGFLLLYFKKRNLAVFFAVFTAVLFVYIIWNNPDNGLVMRLLDENKYSQTQSLGSGRLFFVSDAVSFFEGSTLFDKFFGSDFNYFLSLQDMKYGYRLLTHSQLFDTLLLSGIKGALLLFVFLYFCFAFLFQRRDCASFPLCFSIFVAYVLHLFLQGNSYFFPDIILAFCFSNLEFEYSKKIVGASLDKNCCNDDQHSEDMIAIQGSITGG